MAFERRGLEIEIRRAVTWAGLKVVVERLEDENIKTVEALLVKLTGDFIAAQMLRWLLLWLPHSKRRDGAIYKSAGDWLSETGLSRHQTDRARLYLERVGVNVRLAKAHGAPTLHYELMPFWFELRLAGAINKPVLWVRQALGYGGCQNGFSGNRQMDLPETVKSLTTNTTTKNATGFQKQATQLNEAVEAGVAEPVAERQQQEQPQGQQQEQAVEAGGEVERLSVTSYQAVLWQFEARMKAAPEAITALQFARVVEYVERERLVLVPRNEYERLLLMRYARALKRLLADSINVTGVTVEIREASKAPVVAGRFGS